ncbi:hypothetical protein [Rubrimonas cliftonensis]|uniref:Molybdopterin-guanine dinucleotide biosynthesis protein A n=1 Tax=Rubrimonas cliftonensis TaxID=89524 RepID=A0A1H3VNJ8_9RHOB|nr:hypothetical protein [Rubrimonas cliftonensis]SDZ76271.1 hypothetical protein SAMN05444370_101222 [Rubrimonas cliftonensis]
MRLISLMFAALIAVAAHADDEEGYYYPPVTTSEVFERTLAEAPAADRAVRIGFVTQVTRQQLEHPTPPRFAVFAKGEQAQEMIVIALDRDVFSTLYRARAVMAQLSAPARTTEFFVRNAVSDRATFYDMVKLMGFATLTLSDGETWSHRVTFR